MIHKIDFKDLPKNTKTPIFSYCRKLIKKGFDPNDSLECYRGEQMDFRVKNIGIGAKLTVKENANEGPRFEWYQEYTTGPSRIDLNSQQVGKCG
jgi:hypothetical protein